MDFYLLLSHAAITYPAPTPPPPKGHNPQFSAWLDD